MEYFSSFQIVRLVIILLFVSQNFLITAQTKALVWSDEFDYSGLPAPEKWGYDVGGDGWGNNELQYYTENRTENARVENGHLIIQAHKENYGGNAYTSARLITKTKGDWKYGRIEVKAKLPGGRGGWPAIWMLPTDWVYGGWPASGEIDIMEYVGYDPGVVHGTVHTDAFNHSIGTQQGNSINIADAESNFHVYAIEWTENKIDFFVDGTKYFTFTNQGDWTKWPFDQRFHLILNIAVGGNWGGAQGVDDNIFPVQMEVDYVRVYQLLNEITITGNEFVEPLATNENYQIPNIVGAIYNWNVPSDASLVSGQGTNSISVDWGNTEDTVYVQITYDGNTSELKFPVKLVTITNGDLFIFDNFDDDNIDNILPNNDGSNSFAFSVTDNKLKTVYHVIDASLSPHFTISLERPVKLTDLQVMQIRFKTHNQSNSVVARIDLVDIDGVQTNSASVFKLEPIYSDGEYHLYEFNFEGNWSSNYPNYGTSVNNNRIMKAIVYLNYGFYGKDNQTDSVWIDYIHLIKDKTLSIKNVEGLIPIHVFPNPANDILTVSSPEAFSQIEIYSLQGKKLRSFNTNQNKVTDINISSLQGGVYILKVNNSKGKLINFSKIMKE